MIPTAKLPTFVPVKHWLLLFLFSCLLFAGARAQQKPLDGFVLDKVTKERIARVNIKNTRTGQSVYNNLKAEFEINAQTGDILVFSKIGYFSDTVRVKEIATLPVYLKPSSIMLKQVNITDTLQNPEKRLAAIKEEYNKAYGSSANRDILSVSPGSGAGISIDALYNMLSRSGRNARHLQEIIDRDYRESVIDYRFNPTLVGNTTGLKGSQLTDFMQKYRPSYYTVMNDSEYEFVLYIRNSYRRYIRNPRSFTLPRLVTPPVTNPTHE